MYNVVSKSDEERCEEATTTATVGFFEGGLFVCLFLKVINIPLSLAVLQACLTF